MENIKNVIIIGSGPAGYTAGVYTSRAKLEPVLVGGEINGGQLMNTTVVENWPGASEGVMGPELMGMMRQQAIKFGTQIIDKNVTRVELGGDVKKVYVGELGEEQEYLAKTVIIATGAKSRMLEVSGEERLLGRGVATCAVCDAAFYKDKKTFVVGGGDAAIEDAMALVKFANQVVLLVRGESFRASKIMAERALNHEKIEVRFNTKVKEIKGEVKVEKIVLEGSQGEYEEEADGVFVAIGHIPATEIFKGQVELDEKGFLVTHVNGTKAEVAENVWLNGFPTMTSVEGVFGAGDVVDFRYRQAITSAGFGCMAALDVEKYLTGHGGGNY